MIDFGRLVKVMLGSGLEKKKASISETTTQKLKE